MNVRAARPTRHRFFENAAGIFGAAFVSEEPKEARKNGQECPSSFGFDALYRVFQFERSVAAI